jgi:hypothetical protein
MVGLCIDIIVNNWQSTHTLSSAIMGFGFSFGDVGAWLFFFTWICIDWFTKQEVKMGNVIKLLAETVLTGLGALRVLVGRDWSRH